MQRLCSCLFWTLRIPQDHRATAQHVTAGGLADLEITEALMCIGDRKAVVVVVVVAVSSSFSFSSRSRNGGRSGIRSCSGK